MPVAKHNGQKETCFTLLELVLQLHGDFRRSLEPIRVTPLQAGVILYLHRHQDAKLKDTSAALGVQPPTLGVVINDLVRKRWITKQRAIHDDRSLCLRLSRQGESMARKIVQRVSQLETTLPKHDRVALDMNPQGSRT